MKKFIIKILVFIFLFFVIVALPTYLYFKVDPYQDFGKHKDYSWQYHFQGLGDLAVKKILISDAEYNSFVFGSSRTTGVYACYLNQNIKNSNFFHFANWAEQIGGIHAKVKFIDSLGYDIDNAIIYLDTDTTFKNSGKTKENDHYLVKNQNKYDYYYNHYKAYFSAFNLDKLKLLLGSKVSKEMTPNWKSDLYTNDPRHICTKNKTESYGINKMSKDELIKMDSLIENDFFYNRPEIQSFCENQISDVELKTLKELKALFDKKKTNYSIVISPLYDQLKFSKKDKELLKGLFNENLFDFSGINKITNNDMNFKTDRIHFREHVSKIIIDSLLAVPKIQIPPQ